ncbi:MAG: LysE family transporter [Proteobacteria bacterium]|nr:LysE family transporter [Pseudomonadota bacterium]
MDSVIVCLAILGALAVGVVSPGPSFVLIVRMALAVSRRAGIAAALGMGLGGVVFAGLALLGLHAVLVQAGWLYLAVKLCGAAYLLHLAVGLWRGADRPIAVVPTDAVRRATGGFARSVWIGLATQVSNPKTTIVYASVFAALLPPAPPTWLLVALPPLVFVLEAGWYTIVALTFSAARPRALYGRAKSTIDRLAGAIMGALGVRLIVESVRPG